MIIFYGTRSSQSDKRLPHPCGTCGQPALMQTDWVRYFHIMFVPTFPVGKDRSIQCQACGNSFSAKGSAPFWTYIGGIVLALCFLGGAAHQAIRRLGLGGSMGADITAAASDPSSSASAPAASASAPPKVAAGAHPPAAAAPAGSASGSKTTTPAPSSSVAPTTKKKKKKGG